MDLSMSGTAAMQIPIFSPPANPPGNARNGAKYRSYTEDDMERAVQAIAEEGISLRQAALRYNVPRTTIAERLRVGKPSPHLSRKLGGDDGKKHPRTRYQFTEAEMASAVEVVQSGNGEVSVSEAARRFGVPPSQLSARTRGRTPRDLRSELSRLTLRQESLLADWAGAQCALGCPPTKDELFRLADRVLRNQGAEKRLGKQWINHWMRRYPQVRILEWEGKDGKDSKGKEKGTVKGKGMGMEMEEDVRMSTATATATSFSTSTFEPIADFNGVCYDTNGGT